MFFDDKKRADAVLGMKMPVRQDELNAPKDGEEVEDEDPKHGLMREFHEATMAGDHKGMSDALHAFLLEANGSPGESVPD